jgi:hypothetical protein
MENTQTKNLDSLYAKWSEDSTTPLKTWIGRYPEAAKSLTEWTVAEPISAYAAQIEPSAEEEQRARELGRQRIAVLRAKMEAEKTTPLLSLIAKERGLTLKHLAKQLGVGVALVAKLEDRLLVASGIPQTLIERLAGALSATSEQVRAYLQQPARLAMGAQYKASDVPQVTAQQDFTEAIRTCADMTAEEKAFWLQNP